MELLFTLINFVAIVFAILFVIACIIGATVKGEDKAISAIGAIWGIYVVVVLILSQGVSL